MKLKLFGFSLVALLLASCGGDSDKSVTKEIIVKPEQTEIKGDLKDCYVVVDKEVKVYKELSAYVVQVELKRTEKELPYDRKDVVIFPEADESEKSNLAGFGIEVLDSLGNVIANNGANSTPYSWDEMTAALQLLPGETTTINFHVYDNLSQAAKYRVTSLVEKNQKAKKNTVGNVIDEAIEQSEKQTNEDIGEAIEATKDLIEAEKKLLEML